MTSRILIVVALALGCFYAYVDTRPTWDDTGVEAMVLLSSALVLAAVDSRRPWLLALLIGAPIPLANLLLGHGYVPFAALAFAFAGAYAGATLFPRSPALK